MLIMVNAVVVALAVPSSLLVLIPSLQGFRTWCSWVRFIFHSPTRSSIHHPQMFQNRTVLVRREPSLHQANPFRPTLCRSFTQPKGGGVKNNVSDTLGLAKVVLIRLSVSTASFAASPCHAQLALLSIPLLLQPFRVPSRTESDPCNPHDTLVARGNLDPTHSIRSVHRQ